jgi:hypothetical protein
MNPFTKTNANEIERMSLSSENTIDCSENAFSFQYTRPNSNDLSFELKNGDNYEMTIHKYDQSKLCSEEENNDISSQIWDRNQ